MKKTGLYFIKSLVSGVPVSGILNIMNDISAVKGFAEFCKKENIAPEEHILYKICELDEDNNIFNYSGKSVKICSGDKAEACFKEMFANLGDDD